MTTIPGQIIEGVLWTFLMLLWARFVIDWVQVFARRWYPSGWVVVVLEVIYSITDPPIKAVRRFIPPLRVGPISVDIAFLLVLVAVYILKWLNGYFLL